MEEWTFTCECGRRHTASDAREQALKSEELNRRAKAQIAAISKPIWRKRAERIEYARLRAIYG